jgi:hypothetical protein
MIPETLTTLERELRRASERREYDVIKRVALALGDAARLEVGKLDPGDPAVAEIARHVLDVLERSRILTLVGRSKAHEELRSLYFLQRYISSPRPRRPRLRLHV